ncbi:MAG: hypothetical protein P9M15_04290 [Candidatus Electryoneaceae bacterium]|nr:hypothetical protein [Candidatus Electryoneaceae bacterium]
MFHKRNWLAALIFTVILMSYGHLEAGQLGGQAGAFLRVGLGADRVAMGDCGVALAGGGMNWYYNPASLPYQESRQASLGYRNMSLDRFILYADYSTPIKQDGVTKAGLSLGVIRAGITGVEYRDSNGEKFDVVTTSDNLIHGSFALMPHPRITFGITIKWMINAIPDILEDDRNLYAYGMGIDLGMRFIARKNLQLGIQLRDINSQYSWETSEVWGDQVSTKDDQLPLMLRVGGAWDPMEPLTVVTDLVINTDQIGDDADAFEPRFGLEYRYAVDSGKGFALRAGWNGDVPTFGFRLDLDLWRLQARLDYAFLMDKVAPNESHLIGWVFEF